MRKNILLLMLLVPLMLVAQQHKWDWHRVEVTNVWDSHPDSATQMIVAPYKATVDSVMAPVLGESLVGMTGSRPESLLSNWAADVMVEFSDFHDGKRADMGLVNVGGLRNNMPKGIVRKGDIILISPFQNKLTLLTLTGKQLLQLFSDIAAVKGEGVSKEVRLEISAEGKLLKARLNGKKINPKKVYRIATLDYLAEGNDKMYTLKQAKDVWVSNLYTRDCMMQSIQRAGTINSKIEGRITIKGLQNTEKKVSPKTTDKDENTFAMPSCTPDALTIVHTSDTHSCVEPISKNDIRPEQADKGGYLRRASLLADMRKQSPDLLLLDCGDFSQGSVYYNIFKGEVEVQLMNSMGYDACTIGNHEFDFGLENMARLFRMAQFPIVCCNYDFTGTPCEGLTRDYIIVERAGMRIGVFGVCPQLEGLVSKTSYGNTKFLEPVSASQKVVDTLRNQEHCDIVICLSHLGYTDNNAYNDEQFIRSTRGIDLVLGGHSHTYFQELKYIENLDGTPVPLDHEGKNAQFLGVMQLNHSK